MSAIQSGEALEMQQIRRNKFGNFQANPGKVVSEGKTRNRKKLIADEKHASNKVRRIQGDPAEEEE